MLFKRIVFFILCLPFVSIQPAESSSNKGIIIYDARQLTKATPSSLPVIDKIDSQLLLGSPQRLNDDDSLSQYSFKDLLQNNALEGLPLVLCRVTTTDAQGTTYRQFYTKEISKHFYGTEFPKKIAIGKGAKNPLNCLEPEEVEFFSLELGTNTTLKFTCLGKDAHIVRGGPTGSRIINIMNLSDGLPQEEEGQDEEEVEKAQREFDDSAEKLMTDSDPYIQSTALLHNALRWIKRGTDDGDYGKGIQRLFDCLNITGGNPYAQLKAHYEIVLSYNSYDMCLTKKSSDLQEKKQFRKSLITSLKELSKQSHNLLIRDRAKGLLGLIHTENARNATDSKIIEKETDKAAKQFKGIQKSPTKIVIAQKFLPRLYSPIPFRLDADATTSVATDADKGNTSFNADTSSIVEAENSDNRLVCYSPFSDHSDDESTVLPERRDYC